MGGGGANSLNRVETDKENNEEHVITYKTYDDYFIDYEIPDNLKGAGTKTSPYQIETMEDFLCLTTKNCRSKYIEVKSNIYLNDETFDENGNPHGGDGVVYNWNKSFTINQLVILNGNNHTIYGLYADTTASTSLFGYSAFTTIENINVDNFYMNVSGQSAVLTKEANTIRNCKIKRGLITCTAQQLATLCRETGIVENCENYATVKGASYVSGLVYFAKKLTNCTNYGNVYGTGNDVAGLFAHRNSIDVRFIHCANYGKITGHNYIGGFCTLFAGQTSVMRFINCASYGEIKTTYSVESATYAGGFVASTNGKIIIENCQSNAIISSFGAYTAFFIGAAKKEVIVKDCKADVSFKKNEKNSTCIAGCVTGGLYVDGCDVTINNYHFVNGGHYGGMEVLFGTAYGENGVVQIKNMNINLISYKESEVVYFIRQSGNKCCIENINLTTNFDISTLKLVKTTGNTDADGIVVKSKNLLAFYGSDFSGFFVDYKTGKIGLKALSGKGFYQGKVTEAYLLNNGYIKKTV